MTRLSLYLRTRRALSKRNVSFVKVGRFVISPHAQNSIVERDLSRRRVVRDLVNKPEKVSKSRPEKDGSYSYQRFGKYTVAAIKTGTPIVKTLWARNHKGLKWDVRKAHERKKKSVGKNH